MPWIVPVKTRPPVKVKNAPLASPVSGMPKLKMPMELLLVLEVLVVPDVTVPEELKEVSVELVEVGTSTPE